MSIKNGVEGVAERLVKMLEDETKRDRTTLERIKKTKRHRKAR